MKKPLWFFAAALLLLVLALGGAKLRERAVNPEGFVFDTAQVSEVVWLRVVYQGDSAELRRGTSPRDPWVIARSGEPADAGRVQRALRGLLGVRDHEKVSESGDEARLREFGIDAAEAKRVEWRMASGKSAVILLGKTAGTDLNSTYWKWVDKPGVYSTPGDFTFDLASQEEEWKVNGPAPAFQVQ